MRILGFHLVPARDLHIVIKKQVEAGTLLGLLAGCQSIEHQMVQNDLGRLLFHVLVGIL